MCKTQRNTKLDRPLKICFAIWVQNKGPLSMFCISVGALIRRNIVSENGHFHSVEIRQIISQH